MLSVIRLLSSKTHISHICACGSSEGMVLGCQDPHNLGILPANRSIKCGTVYQSYYPPSDWISDFYENHYQFPYS